MPYTYSKNEKLKQNSEINMLFQKGKWKTYQHLRIIYLEVEENAVPNTRVGVSVSKRFFKKATDRNRIKRLLRECYRLHKDVFLKAFGTHTLVMMFWASKDFPSRYQEVEREFLKLCAKVEKQRETTPMV